MAIYRSLVVCGLVASASGAFTGGARAAPKKAVAKKAVAKKAAPSGKVKNQGFFSSGVAPTKAKSKLAISTAKTSQQYIDVTGGAYNAVDTFLPQFDEIGVLPPLGRWDPLQIREQVCAYSAGRARARGEPQRRTGAMGSERRAGATRSA